MLLRIMLPLVSLALLSALLNDWGHGLSSEKTAVSAPWLATDEFGRNLWGSLAQAMLLSLAKGLAITMAIATVASTTAYVVVRDNQQWLRMGLRATCAVVESVPLVLWVVIVVVSVSGPRLWVTLVAFSILALPSITQIFLGEFTRLRTAPFSEAASLLGISELRIFFVYLLPAAIPILVPVLIQILGSAIAIDGAIGVFGLGNRSDIDLGVFLLRGREQFIVRPELLASSLLAYGILYLYLQWLGRSFGAATTGFRKALE